MHRTPLLFLAAMSLALVLAGCAQPPSVPSRPIVHAVDLPGPASPPQYISYRDTSFNAPATVPIGELPAHLTGDPGIFAGDAGPGVFYGDSSGYTNHDHYFRPGSHCNTWGYGGYSSHCRTGYTTITPLRTATRR